MNKMTEKRVEANHRLHHCSSASAFVAEFTNRCAHSPLDVVNLFVKCEYVACVIVGGSLPLGIANAASDVDLYVLVNCEVQNALWSAGSGTLYTGSFENGLGRTERATVVTSQCGVEVDVNVVELEWVRRLLSRTERSGAALTIEQVMVLSRIKTGWILDSGAEFKSSLEPLLNSDALELRVSVGHLRNAVKAFGHAEVAAENDTLLSIYLGSAAVEWTFQAILAAAGIAYAGEKWLSLLHGPTLSAYVRDAQDPNLFAEGVSLLFPVPSESSGQTQCYLAAVSAWIDRARRVIERNVSHSAGNRLCKQIYWLREEGSNVV